MLKRPNQSFFSETSAKIFDSIFKLLVSRRLENQSIEKLHQASQMNEKPWEVRPGGLQHCPKSERRQVLLLGKHRIIDARKKLLA